VDLTDGFFHQRVAKASRKYLGVKLPATGEIMRYTGFPFGLAVSPHYFCAAISEVHQLLRFYSTLFSRGHRCSTSLPAKAKTQPGLRFTRSGPMACLHRGFGYGESAARKAGAHQKHHQQDGG
jgi:hypothetical protein